MKFILKNIKEKKFRTFLIIFSITASSALFFASLAISNTFEKNYVGNLRNLVGNSDIYITSNKNSKYPFIDTYGAEKYTDKLEYIVACIRGSGEYRLNKNQAVNIFLYGYDFNELQKFNKITVINEFNLQPFSGKKIIISSNFAKKYNLRIGDKLPLYTNGIKLNFIVSGIAAPKGIFSDEIQNSYAIVPKEILDSVYSTNGRVSTIFVKLKDPSQQNKLIKELSQQYAGYDVQESVNMIQLAQMTNQVRIPFLMMLIVVIFISIFLIYTVFKIIALERLPVIGTFRSIGATKITTNSVLILESFVYGITGGILGDFSGLGILYIMAEYYSSNNLQGVKTVIDYTNFQLISAFLMAVFLSLASSIIPIIRASKFPIKDIILNKIEQAQHFTVFRLISGIILIIISISVPMLIKSSIALQADSLCLVLTIAALLLLIPYIIKLFAILFRKIFYFIFKNEGLIALKNIVTDKAVINNITLLSIGISAIFTISTISYSFGLELISAYNIFKYEIYFTSSNASKADAHKIEMTEGVSGALGFYADWNVKVSDKNTEIMELDGVDKNKFLDFLDVETSENMGNLLDSFDEDRNILITNVLKDRMNVKAGDMISLRLGKKIKKYRVIGFFNTTMQDGSFAFIPEKYFRLDTGESYYDHIAVKIKEGTDKVKARLENEFAGSRTSIYKISDFKESNRKDFNQLISMLNIFSVLTMFIGIFGMLNNFLISFIERKRSFALLASLGMSRLQLTKMLFIEALSSGILGGAAGILAGINMCFIIPKVTGIMELPLDVYFSPQLICSTFIISIIVSLISASIPILKARKLNIIESIKYE